MTRNQAESNGWVIDHRGSFPHRFWEGSNRGFDTIEVNEFEDRNTIAELLNRIERAENS